MQRLDLADTVSLAPAVELAVDGFAGDTLVRRALEGIAALAATEPSWHARIEKRIPVAAGLGGGSSDAATALALAERLLDAPPSRHRVLELARSLGADVPFFLGSGPQLGVGDGTELEPVDLRQDYTVLLLLPHGERKPSTGEIYGRFRGEAGFAARRDEVVAVARAGPGADLASLPPNDLASSPFSDRLRGLGAFRADVSGAGPTVYALFVDSAAAEAARTALAGAGETWLTKPAW
jgi:4-diphosphocytidyl-2-C-methyl-D-erythritol kinase